MKDCNCSYPNSTPYGIIYNKNQWSDTSDFDVIGSGSVNLSSNYIELSGPNSALMLSNLGYTCLDHQYQKLIIDIGTIDSNNTGIGLGRRSTSSGANAPLTLLFNPFTGGVTLNGTSSGSTTIPNSNDIIQLEADFSLKDGKATFTITNLTQPSVPVFVGTYTYVISYPLSGSAMPNTGFFSIYKLGTTPVTIQSYEVNSNTLRNAKLWISGNSKSTGRFASTIPNGWAEKTRTRYGNVVNASGGGDTSIELLTRIPEIVKFSPRKVLLEIGSNDLRIGDSEANFETRYLEAVNQIESAGIKVYHMLTMPETAQNLTTQKNFILNNFPSNRIINSWTPLLANDGHSLNPIYIGDGSGVHFNDAGHEVVYTKVVDFFKNTL